METSYGGDGAVFANQRTMTLQTYFLGLMATLVISSTAWPTPMCTELIFNDGQYTHEWVIERLQSLNNESYKPENWRQIGNYAENTHEVYLLSLGRISAVVKFGERSYDFEPLAYKLAFLLHIDVPPTVPVVMGGMYGMAQLYVPNTTTLLKASDVIEPNIAIELFDLLTLQADRNHGNILLSMDNPWEWETEQIAIDHEQMFHPRSVVSLNTMAQGPAPFLLANMTEIKKRFPDVHQAFLDPVVQGQVLSLVRAQREINSEQVRYVENFFKVYQRIANLLGV